MRRYLISSSAMDWRIRPLGTAIRLVHPAFTQRSFRSANVLLDRFLAGRWLGRSTSVTQAFVTRPDGTRLRLLVCRSRRRRSDAPVTGLLWLHGGGYGLGVPEQDFIFGDLFCGDGSCVAVLPDYRRSTEAPYPAALEDCYLTLEWMHQHAEELGINRRQLFVGGDSAGGGLTAAVCLRARDEGTIPVTFQLPLYPMLDDRGITASSRGNDAPVWNTASNETAWRLYLRGVDEVPAYAAPARAEDLAGFPRRARSWGRSIRLGTRPPSTSGAYVPRASRRGCASSPGASTPSICSPTPPNRRGRRDASCATRSATRSSSTFPASAPRRRAGRRPPRSPAPWCRARCRARPGR